MSIQITICAAKKLPHPTHQFGSISAQVSLVGEAGTLADAPAIMRDLFATAQAGCDQHLAEQSGASQMSPAPQHTPPQSPTTSAPSTSPAQRPAASQPYRNGGPQRRQPATPISAAQARYLSQLGQRAQGALAEALTQHGVTTIDALTGRDASKIIDHLLQVAA